MRPDNNNNNVAPNNAANNESGGNDFLVQQLAQLMRATTTSGGGGDETAHRGSTAQSQSGDSSAFGGNTNERSNNLSAQAIITLLNSSNQRQQQRQQQQPQTQQQPLLSREANAQAQALLLIHEERLRATRLLLEEHQRQGNAGSSTTNLPQHPLLMATEELAAAKRAQESILSSLGGGAAIAAAVGSTGGGATLDQLAPSRIGSLGDRRNRATALSGEGEETVGAATDAANAAVSEDGAIQRGGGDSDEDNENENENMDGDEGYDDDMSDEDYFKNFSTQDDNRMIQETFPLKLYRMLFEVEKIGKQNLISFLPHGKSFVVHKPRAFVDEIMPKYFTTARLASFQRQLNLYGFRRITEGREKGAYCHDFFLKGKRALCRKVKRQKTRVKASQQQHSFADLPSTQSQGHMGAGQNLVHQGTVAAAAAATNANDIRSAMNSQYGLGHIATPTLFERLPSGGTLPSTNGIGVASNDVSYSLLQEALRRGLLPDVNGARQQHGNAASNILSAQDLQQMLIQEQETERIIQRLQQHQQQDRQQRRQSQNDNRG